MTTTIKDVARRAGVSPMTASRALNRPELVATGTRARVLAACQALDYRPNEAARMLRTNKSRLTGLIVPDLRNPFWTDVVSGAEEVMTAAGFELLIGNSNEAPDRLARQTHAMLSRRVAGLLIAPTEGSAALIAGLQAGSQPLALVDRLPAGITGTDWVVIDNEHGAYCAALHLIDAGHERIGLLAGNINLDTGQQRVDGYRRALRERGLALRDDWVYTAPSNAALIGRQTGYAGALELLALPRGPSALLCTSNTIAGGALLALRERGARIPRDVALVSFGNTEWSALVTPALTVITQPTIEMGCAAARLLLERIGSAGAPGAPRHITLKPELIVRGSSQHAPPADGEAR